MLKRFYVNNFRSLLNFEFRPTGLNLLVGENNAGKTNLCWAIYFMGLSSRLSLENAIKEATRGTWNITNSYVSANVIDFEVEADIPDDNTTLSFTYTLSIVMRFGPAGARQQLCVSEEYLKVTGGEFKQTPLIINREGKVQLLHEKRFLANLPESRVETQCPEDATMLSRLYDLETNRRANIFKRYLQSWCYFNLTPYALRIPEVSIDQPILNKDGGNLSKVLFMLHNENPRLERKIIENVRSLEPKLDLFTFNSPDSQHVYFFLEDSAGNKFSSQTLSDGTLRFLALTYLILSATPGVSSQGAPLLSIIEEPENGLYVGHLKPLLETIDPSGKCGQFVFTSHSPYFIDLFDKNLDGLHLLKRGKPSSTLTRPDPVKIQQLLGEMPLGEMHFRELLG